MSEYLFTSESVSEGHPDKVADQISDAILDKILESDPEARVACETLVKTGMVLIAGEYRCKYVPDFESCVRKVLADIGYVRKDDNFDNGFDANTCSFLNALGPQSMDIAHGVDERDGHEQGAGDQGFMFGYASRETSVLMPGPINLSHNLMCRHALIRKQHGYAWLLGPDAKTQVTFRYQDNNPLSLFKIEEIVLSTHHAILGSQHNDIRIDQALVEELVRTEIIAPVLQTINYNIADVKRILVNPGGAFETGGPVADCGLTGRKIIVDTYGGSARHGGGAFSGKDPSKTDRSAAYMARYMAKNIVTAELADRCEIQISYAIGQKDPRSIHVDTFGSGKVTDAVLQEQLSEHFDLTPKGIIKCLDLLNPFYRITASNGHFGRNNPAIGFTWERTDQATKLRDALL